MTESTGKMTGEACKCTVCFEVFQTERGFDKHRIGRHGIDRKCLDGDGMRKIGMVINSYGRWGTRAYDKSIHKSDEISIPVEISTVDKEYK